jgi:hypothetical protein
MKKISLFSFLLGFVVSTSGWAQDYHAIEGSPFAGSLGVSNNPASILSTPYPWDVTLFSAQGTWSTNALTVYNLSLLSFSDSSKYGINNGNYGRRVNFDYNIHLLNARIALGRTSAIAFGANLRGYGIGHTSAYNYSDTIHNIRNYLDDNPGNEPYSANFVTSSWIELFATYAHTFIDDGDRRLNVGLTLRAMRGISGAYAQFSDGTTKTVSAGGKPVYQVSGGNLRYGYSSNFDAWHNGNSTGQNLNNFLNLTQGGAAFDLGAEYLLRTQALSDPGSNEDDYYDYNWKIGVSLLDIGENRYKYGNQSLATTGVRNVADSILDRKFGSGGIDNLQQFKDTLSTVVGSPANLRGLFNILNPARLVINVDRPLENHFAINANLSFNLTGSNEGKRLGVKEMNLLTVTPRWETRRWGLYLPIQYNTENQLWIGGAFKAGPLLFGIHNWGFLFAKQKMANGGGYIALIIHPGHGFGEKEDKRYGCPVIRN